MIFTLGEAFERLREPNLDRPSSSIREAYRLALSGYLPGDFDIIRAEERISEHFRFALIVHCVRYDEHLQDRIQSREEDLRETQWSCLQALIRASGFWDLSRKGGHIGVDGYSACLEGYREGKYHSVCRWCPSHKHDNEWFELPCCYLSDLALWLVPENAELQ